MSEEPFLTLTQKRISTQVFVTDEMRNVGDDFAEHHVQRMHAKKLEAAGYGLRIEPVQWSRPGKWHPLYRPGVWVAEIHTDVLEVEE